jgi:hypothetical protein
LVKLHALTLAGLENNTLTLTMYMSYAAAETYATLQPLVGTQVTVSVKPGAGAASATNPKQVLTGGPFWQVCQS